MPQDVHLLRGSPAVRSWSKYQSTVEAWTLCGIRRKPSGYAAGELAPATEDASQVTCRYCRMLMATTATMPNRAAPSLQKRKATAG